MFFHQLESFAYDELGNRTSDNQGNYVYDNKKFRLDEDWRYVYVYDTNGNLTSRQDKGLQGKVQNFIYSSENQLVAIEFFDNNFLQKRVEYLYDALGRRAEKKITENNQESIRRFTYLNNEIIAELDGENEVLVKYTHSGLRTDDVLEMEVTAEGQLVGIAPEGAYYFAKDGLGSIVDVHNSAGAVVQHYVYSSFGKILKITNGGVDNTSDPLIKNRFTYTNREFDEESGLYYYRARYYDAHSGRFMQEDPHPGTIGSPKTFSSKYAYVSNSPLNFTDPSGEFLTAMVVGALAGAILNEVFDLDFSVFQAMVIGAVAGVVAAEFVLGIGFEGLGIVEKTIGVLGYGAAGGILGAVGTTILLGIATQNDTFKKNLDQAFYLGAAVGAVVGIGMVFFPNYLDAQIYGRINLIPHPLEYAMAFPADVVGGALFVGSKLFCGGRELSKQGEESCGF